MIHKKNRIQSLAFAGMMTAIQTIFLLLSLYQATFLVSDLLLILFLPLLNALAFLFLDRRLVFTYALASLLIGVFISVDKTLFYLLPGLVTGFLSGFLLEKKVHPIWILASTTIAQSVLSLALYGLLDLLFDFSVSEAFRLLFSLNFEEVTIFFPLFILLTSLAQCLITLLVLLAEIKKFDIEVRHDEKPIFPLSILALAMAVLAGSVMFLSTSVAYFAWGLALLLLLPSFYIIFIEKRYAYLIISLLVLLFSFALLHPMLEEYGVLSSSYWMILQAILGVILAKKRLS